MAKIVNGIIKQTNNEAIMCKLKTELTKENKLTIINLTIASG